MVIIYINRYRYIFTYILVYEKVQILFYLASQLQHQSLHNFSILFTYIFQNLKISCENYNRNSNSFYNFHTNTFIEKLVYTCRITAV